MSLASTGKSQPVPFSEHDYQKTIKLRFDYDTLLTHKPNTPGEAFLFHYKLTLAFMVSENSMLIKVLDENEARIEELIEKASEPWKLFFQAEIKLHRAFINLKLGNELTAAWNMRQAYKLSIKNGELHPDFIYNNKTIGLLHVLIGSIPDQYQWVVDLMGMEGDIQKGLDELDKISRSNNIVSTESKVLQCIIHAYLLNNADQALKQYDSLIDNSPLLNYIGMAVAMKNSNAATAISFYEQAQSKNQNPLLSYLAGEAYLQLGNYHKASQVLNDFLNQFEGDNFIKDALYKLALAAMLQNNDNKALLLLNKAKNRGQTLTEADKHAAKMINLGLPDPTIMKIRLFTDGGQYQRADSIIEQVEKGVIKVSNELELTYRKARLHHKLNDFSKAISLYKNVVSLQSNDAYFAPNSCLQLGYIYQNRGEESQAKYFFEKVLSYKHHEYKNSLDNKAKVALKGLKDTDH